jgi:thermitase
MKPKISTHRNLIISAVIIAALNGTSHAAPPPGYTQILLKPQSYADESALNTKIKGRKGFKSDDVHGIGVRVITVPTADAAQLLSSLAADGNVEYAEFDGTAYALGTANDPYYTGGSEWHLSKIQAPAAWDLSTGSTSKIVAVVDTGVNFNHPDLAGKLLSGGYDFIANDSDPTDENGHGTAVAGTLSPATNNALGVAGVSWNTPILPIRVLDASGSGSYSAIANGITYAADHGAKIINLSLGGTTSSTTLQNAVNYAWSKGCVIVAAAGNSGSSSPEYPAACTNVIAVSATDSNDARPSWSNYGSYVDISAPGTNICTLYGSNQYANWNGTSFSSPIVSGVLALMASTNGNLSNSALVTALLNNTDDIGTAGYDVYFGYGRVNAYKAVSAAKALLASDTVAPVAAVTSPANGTTIKGTSQNISFSATDNVAVTKLQLIIDGTIMVTTTSSSATYTWSTRQVSKGSHTLKAVAYDAAGNVGTSAVVTVTK